jgi:hypothetical protein
MTVSTTSIPAGQLSSDQGLSQIFTDNFTMLTQQTDSQFVSTGVATFLPSGGRTVNMARIGGTELVTVTGRNPDKQYSDFAQDNRQMTRDRQTRTFLIDEKDDIDELIADPTSQLYKALEYAKNRSIDRFISTVAVGSVLIGRPDRQTSLLTAANDGVLTVDASAGLTYEKVQEMVENYINNDVPMSVWSKAVLAITGTENTDLMSEAEFISSDYISGRPVENGTSSKTGTFNTLLFAGSKTGGVTVNNPILTEGSTLRKCVLLAPESIGLSMEINSLRLEPSAGKVGSKELTIDFWIGAMRKEGVLVQQVNTTI